MVCRNCYQEVPAGSKFCPHCGKELAADIETNQVKQTEDASAVHQSSVKGLKTSTILLLLIILGSAVFAGVKWGIPAIENEKTYKNAVLMMNEGSYEAAIEAFESLGEYRDSASKSAECVIMIMDEEYNAAVKLKEEGLFNQAIDAFRELDDYKDSRQQMQECKNAKLDIKYEAAISLLEGAQFQDAYQAFIALNGYKESARKANECAAQVAKGYEEEGEYLKAITWYEKFAHDQAKANDVRYQYVLKNKNRTDIQTYEFLNWLIGEDYDGAKEVYSALYTPKVNLILNSGEYDLTTEIQANSERCSYYAHFSAKGGPPAETIDLRVKVELRSSHEQKFFDFHEYYYSIIPDGRVYTFQPAWSAIGLGEVRVTIYDDQTGEQLAQKSVKNYFTGM